MSTADQTIIDLLKEFGFSPNACKTYLTLLKNNPATGYEISTQASIPRSAIYSVLKRLQNMNIINEVGSDPKKYVPLSPSSLLEHLSRLSSDRIETLQQAFDMLDVEEEAFDFWHLHGYKHLILKLKESINEAKVKIFLSIWRKEYNTIAQELHDAHERGVDIIIFSFSEFPLEFGSIISYGLNEEDLIKIWNPKIIAVVDQKTTIMGSTIEKSTNRTIWTNNEAITEIATNHIILDITLAGQRLDIDVNPIVQKMMTWSDLHLQELIENHKTSLSKK
jgi:sugar-specific transcriptional regulator TrmB